MKVLRKTRLNNLSHLMRRLFVASAVFSVTPFLLAQELVQQTVEITTADQFKLSAQFSAGSPTAGGVLLLHDCQHSVTGYQSLYAALVEQGVFVLALDLRGYGGSQNDIFSEQKIRQQSDDIVSYQGQLAGLMLHWQKDVFTAFKFLQRAMANNQAISIVTNGCSSNQAIYLAEKISLKSVVMLAPELSYGDKEQFKHLSDMQIYLISTKHQTEDMLNARELFDWSGDSQSVLQIFKGNASSYQLLKQQPYLHEHIAIWLKDTLNE